ncbi:MAG: DUF3142 domain-containing protein [Pyrinomonadaceae bacterium]
MRYLSVIISIVILLMTACGRKNMVDPRLESQMPSKIIWAWERPEDLSFINPQEYGVAFLAQTLLLENDKALQKARRQPLEVPSGTYMIAVTRIETNKESGKRAYFNSEMVNRVASLVRTTLDLPDVRAVQIDFDAAASEREFYGLMMKDLKGRLPADMPLTMTALASWCTGDAWFNDLPVAEAVPMVFQMGSDTEKIKTFLRNGNDWSEPLCRGSYGISLDEKLGVELRSGRRMYYFKSGSWSARDKDALR